MCGYNDSSENHTNHINAFCEQNIELMCVRRDGTYNNYYGLQGLTCDAYLYVNSVKTPSHVHQNLCGSSTEIVPLLFLRANPTKVKRKVLQLSALLIAQVCIYNV